MSKCEHGLTSAECFVCASPKYGAPQQQAEPLGCGHHASLAVTSAETGEFLYCDLCDCKSARRDAEQMEESLRAELATLKAQQQAEQVRLIETQPGSPNFDGADAWNAQPTESRITAEQVEGLKRLVDEYAKAASTPEYNDEAEPNARAALHAALDALKGEA